MGTGGAAAREAGGGSREVVKIRTGAARVNHDSAPEPAPPEGNCPVSLPGAAASVKLWTDILQEV